MAEITATGSAYPYPGANIATHQIIAGQGGGGGNGGNGGTPAADALSNAYETMVGGSLLLGQTLTGPATVYAALFTADPGETGDLSAELNAASYQRVAISFGAPTTDGEFANDQECLFPVTTESWGTVTHMAITTQQSGGSIIVSMPLGAPVTVAAGEQLRINPGALTVTFS